MRLPLLALIAGLVLAVPASAAPPLVADYRFDDTLTSSVGTAPALEPLIAFADPAYVPTFETVGGDRSAVFGLAQGFSVGTAGLLPRDAYGVAVRFRFGQISGYRRIIRFSDGAGDNGVYNRDGAIGYYNNQDNVTSWNPGTGLLAADTDALVVFTRSADGMNRVYLDGVLQAERPDATSTSLLSSDLLRFFVDDGGENAPGSVSRISLFAGTLSAEDVAGIAGLQNAPPPAPPAPPAPPTEPTSTLPSTTLPPALPSASVGFTRATLAGRTKGSLRSGVRFTCPAGTASCRATLTARSVPPRGRKPVTYARTTVTVRPGTSVSPTLRLSRTAAAAARKAKRLRVALDAAVTGPDGKRVTLKRTVTAR